MLPAIVSLILVGLAVGLGARVFHSRRKSRAQRGWRLPPTMSVAAFGFFSMSCGEVSQSIDCHYICERYQDCFDSAYDVGACTDRCEAMYDSDPHGADDCETCVDDRSCSGAVFPCADECSSIVP